MYIPIDKILKGVYRREERLLISYTYSSHIICNNATATPSSTDAEIRIHIQKMTIATANGKYVTARQSFHIVSVFRFRRDLSIRYSPPSLFRPPSLSPRYPHYVSLSVSLRSFWRRDGGRTDGRAERGPAAQQTGNVRVPSDFVAYTSLLPCTVADAVASHHRGSRFTIARVGCNVLHPIPRLSFVNAIVSLRVCESEGTRETRRAEERNGNWKRRRRRESGSRDTLWTSSRAEIVRNSPRRAPGFPRLYHRWVSARCSGIIFKDSSAETLDPTVGDSTAVSAQDILFGKLRLFRSLPPRIFAERKKKGSETERSLRRPFVN